MLQVISFFFIDSLLLSFKVTYSFLSHGGKKRTKESPPSAHLPLKITHVFGRAARRALRSLCGAALFSKNAPDFINAPDVRTEAFDNIEFGAKEDSE